MKPLKKGAHIWIPCEVKEGPFPDERLVRVRSDLGDSLAFVRTEFLKEPISEGQTFVRALVVDVHGEKFIAELPGQEISSKEFEGYTSKVSA